MEKCGEDYQPVCGSNGTQMTTFDNRCELFRQSCLLENSHDKSIKFVAPTTCKKGKKTSVGFLFLTPYSSFFQPFTRIQDNENVVMFFKQIFPKCVHNIRFRIKIDLAKTI